MVRCRGAERWLLVQGAEVQRRCRGGAEVVQRWCRGAEEVVRCREAEVQRWCRGGGESWYTGCECRGGAWCRGSGGAEVQKW